MKPGHFAVVCRCLKDRPNSTQRELAADTKLSLGLVNGILKECLAAGYLMQREERSFTLTEEGLAYLEAFRVKNAIILAAGFGSRCVPLTYETPKGLLKVYGQPMIERQIEQLLEKEIKDIVVVVGYKKEAFDYLIDKYGVRLVYNPEYAVKNNLSSLYRALPGLDSTYLLMADHWIEKNIFNTYEARSWYSCLYFDGSTYEWCVTTSPSDKIESITIGGQDTWAIVGPAYFSPSFSERFRQYAADYYSRPGTDDYYWEHILKENLNSLPIHMNRQAGNVYEFENLEELRLFDPSYNKASNSKIMAAVARIFNVSEGEIQKIQPIKVGMTNHSFIFTHGNTRYIMRIPGEGTEKLIDREREYAVYQTVTKLDLCDDVIYIDPKNGYKITAFLEDARVCDPFHPPDIRACMKRLREFHEMKLRVEHTFNVFERIEFYEGLRLDSDSCFSDYQSTKANVMSLEKYLDSVEKDWALAHIDAVPDNFLLVKTDGKGQVRLIDWEYAGMQDPHIDIAMFAVYSMYDREQIDALINCYFNGKCPDAVRIKIYAYIAVCGLLWSNWCEYKRQMGVEFGEYALRQYRFAKDYFRVFSEEYK